MEISILKDNKKYKDRLYEMLKAADDEFVPPLSARSSTTQKNLAGGEKSEDGIKSYFDEMMQQKIMVAKENGKIIAFVSFRENHIIPEISETPNIYLSTLSVSKEGRGKGITYSMYERLFEEYKNSYVFTRTWSTNYAHIKILSKFDFDIIKTLKDDRGVGIDTVYFKKNRRD